mgnify:CR=1 FL=1
MISKRQFISLISEGSFLELFVSELGWNRFRGQSQLPAITIDEVDYCFTTIAERNGFQILTCNVNTIPTNTICKKIDTKLRRQANDYIAIFQLGNTQHHLWVVPVKANEKRDLVFVEYETAEKADLLYSKIEGFSFNLGEETNIVDLRSKVQGVFAVNSEKITKDFYSGFKKEHTAFVKFISGIDDNIADKDNKNKNWYTSIMLNRLMFCYFIQKKGFLNLDFDYLRHKLEWVRTEQGENRFFCSFYKGFLVQLFHEGLNAPVHDSEFERIYGKIPYLNGGMFDTHFLEDKYPDIEIEDDAFIRLFDFFDKWRWHLDTRITASGKDINPDVLGYIFEQYINDRAQMGAYYTKEDITEYIGRNCILPFLFDKVKDKNPDAFNADGYVWTTLRNSGNRYIFDAVKKGYDRFDDIPENIRRGIITKQMHREYCETPVGELPEKHIPLATLRADWNKPTPEPWALPTEIWRETIERLQRCSDIISKIRNGEIYSINDFITYNLDIRLFTADLLAKADRLFIKHFYDALQNITILDPTCGSGAFLFAAMNILEPLYEECITRMQEEPTYFKKQLSEISDKYRSNIQYFIFKSIILRNLYGVDIMAEATEIAKLRLFLKMVAVVDVDRRQPNLGLDPLPDIDFNIRCGNTLVGYANEEQLNKDLSFAGDILQELANQEFKNDIEQEMSIVAITFERFKELQLTQDVNLAEFKRAKAELKSRLAKLNHLLNQKLYLSTHIQDPDNDIFASADYAEWKESHQPFHWLAEFYQIIHGNGGFDVIVGNPPYVECRQNELKNMGCSERACLSGNLYSAIIDRCLSIISSSSNFGMIIPISYISTKQHSGVRKAAEFNHCCFYSSYDIRPAHLFEGAAQRLAIAMYVKSNATLLYTDKQIRWYSETRNNLFKCIVYREANTFGNGIFRYGGELASGIVRVVLSNLKADVNLEQNKLFVATTANNFIKAINQAPRYYSNDVPSKPSGWRCISIAKTSYKKVVCTINSSLFYWIWKNSSDGFNLTTLFIMNNVFIESEECFDSLFLDLMNAFQKNSEPHIRMQKTTGKTEIQLFRVKPLKPILDKIDYLLSLSLKLSEEQYDFIINYDIKYRMGDELN